MFKQRFSDDDSDSGDEKIVLDRAAFKALASDTRVDILKQLNERRKTLTEISESLKLSVPTVKEHLSNLSNAELISMKDEGRKWKYYELTEKGKAVLYPERRKIWILLVSFLFVIGFTFISGFFNVGMSLVDNPNDMRLMMSMPNLDDAMSKEMTKSGMVEETDNVAEIAAYGGSDNIAESALYEAKSMEDTSNADLNDATSLALEDDLEDEYAPEPEVLHTDSTNIEYGKMQTTNYFSYFLVFADIVVVSLLIVEVTKFSHRKNFYKKQYKKLMRKHN